MTKYGYIRVSTIEQEKNHSFENQKRSLIKVGVNRKNIYQEIASAKNLEREQLQKLLTVVKNGDEIFVHRLDRLARNTLECLRLVDTLEKQGVALSLPEMTLTGDSISAKFFRTLYSLFSELETTQLKERQKEGIARAKKLKRYNGRKTVITPKIKREVETLLVRECTKIQIANAVKLSRSTVYKIIKQIDASREKHVLEEKQISTF